MEKIMKKRQINESNKKIKEQKPPTNGICEATEQKKIHNISNANWFDCVYLFVVYIEKYMGKHNGWMVERKVSAAEKKSLFYDIRPSLAPTPSNICSGSIRRMLFPSLSLSLSKSISR